MVDLTLENSRFIEWQIGGVWYDWPSLNNVIETVSDLKQKDGIRWKLISFVAEQIISL